MADIDHVDLMESIEANAPSFIEGGKTYYIVERDLAVAEDQLEAYAKGIVAPKPTPGEDLASGLEELVAATINGKVMRWKLGTKLTWALDRSTFSSSEQANRVQAFVEKATADWNSVASDYDLDIRFQQGDNESAVFRVVFRVFDDPDTYASAFFPNASNRTVRVGPLLLAEDSEYDPVGVMRHELGHVLGFRHEHIRPEAPPMREQWVVGNISGEALTKMYDAKSLMHYPIGEGFGTTDFQITQLDREGFANLYRMPQTKVREFSP